ncbi:MULTISPECIES: CoA-binding protein [Flavobacteriaceae]|uniref:CoA-binding protein n=1 Tax=Flavobacteriaceae TaxID=49546 RepID=UPI0014922656|nr:MULTISPECIES: CoA-binding protein [Allomuricauda]MDC6367735.1 CoA-binding protein [Muricauda sp. AC10]
MIKTLVFGVSVKPYKYSNLAVRRLVENKIDTVAFGHKEGVVDGVEIQNDLNGFKDIDTITLYLNPKIQQEYYQTIIELKPRRVIFNPGTENPEFYSILKNNGIQAEEACTLVLLATGQY